MRKWTEKSKGDAIGSFFLGFFYTGVLPLTCLYLFGFWGAILALLCFGLLGIEILRGTFDSPEDTKGRRNVRN